MKNDATVIFEVWGDEKGYVSLPRKKRDNSNPKGPRNHAGKWEEGKMFKWPEERRDILIWLNDSIKNGYDQYWCPCVFTKPRRVKENISSMRTLYADLDEVAPSTIPQDILPNLAWESSPGRYSAVWSLDKPLDAQTAEVLNKRLTYYIGADKGGWDLTQVLRVPGLRNYKYEGAPKGKVLWHTQNQILYNVINDLPDVDTNALTESVPDDTLLESEPILLPDLIRPYLNKLNTKVLELLFTPADEIMLHDRSSKLWELECKLLEARIPKGDVVKIVAASNWNKYKGRRDETKRIVTEVEKAAQDIPDEVFIPLTMEKQWTSYGDLMGQRLDEPGWMIEEVWQRSSHGMIAGEPKTYKSVIATDMAVSVASGTPFLNKFAVHHQGPVLIIQEENAPWLVQDRINKIAHSRGLLEGKVDIITSKKLKVQFPPILPIYFMNNCGFNLTQKDDRDFLEKSIREMESPPALIILDSLYLMLGGTDENSAKDIRPILEWLLKLRYVFKTSIVILHHWNKAGKSERGGQRMLGSVLLHAWVESAMYTAVQDEERHEIVLDREFRSFTKPNKLEVKFTLGQPGELTYAPTTGDVKIVEDKEYDVLLDLLASGSALSEEELRDTLSLKMSTVRARLKKHIEDGKVVKDGNNYRIKRSQDDE